MSEDKTVAIIRLYEMPFERRMEALQAAQRTLAALGHRMLVPDVDEVINAFIEAYNTYENDDDEPDSGRD